MKTRFRMTMLLPGVLGVALSTTLFADSEAPPVTVKLATEPALSPDGARIAFGWGGDIWAGRTRGGPVERLTSHAAYENGPVFSPDGSQIAFTSNRTGKDQVFVMPATGGIPRRVTFHSEGSRVVDWYPDGKSLLIAGARDFATRSATRFYRINLEAREAESLLFDAESGGEAALSPDGKRLLFTREGNDLYRKGYRGSRASQIWLAENLESGKPKFTKLIARETGAHSPIWKPDGSGFIYAGDHGEGGLFDLWEFDFKTKKEKQLTDFRDEPAIRPAGSRDGSTIVFRKGFEFFRLRPHEEGKRGKARRVAFEAAADALGDTLIRRTLTKAENVSFSRDGLEMAFTSGGDIWVMDTELKEPVNVTRTAEEEREPVMSPDGEAVYFIRDGGTAVDVWRAARSDPEKFWWRNREFKETRITRDGAEKSDLNFVPGGEKISYIAGRGDLWVSGRDGNPARRLIESWNAPQYRWSPDGKWIAYSLSDNNFNRDIWIMPADKKRPPFNLSRHPDSDENPVWSPDGKMLAFTGRRFEQETDIYSVYLTKSDAELDKRDRVLTSALEKLEKERKKPAPPKPPGAPPSPAEPKADDPIVAPATGTIPAKPVDDPAKKEETPGAAGKPEEEKKEEEKKPEEKPEAKLPEVKIDFDGIYERIRRISIPNSTESGLFWSHDSKRLAFSGEAKGAKGTYTVTFPDKLTPVLLNSKQGSLARWIAKNDAVLWLVDGVPASLSKGNLTSYAFRARQQFDRADYWRNGFRQIWRTMGLIWYDENLNHRDWDAAGDFYEAAAAGAVDAEAFDRVIAMLLGELNGSHLGFRSSSLATGYRPPDGWSEETAHLGVRFDPAYGGPGLKVKSVVREGPADEVESRLRPGDVILDIDGMPVDRGLDLTKILNGPIDRDIYLKVRPAAIPEGDAGKANEKKVESSKETAAETKPKTVVIRPVSYARIRDLMEQEVSVANRALVDRLSGGKIGYVFVERMGWNEFIKFEEEIYARGAGKEGLIIDVRNNGGGFTSDHLLTVLTPAEHAITVPRGGEPGYPQDRRVYATWNKPVTVLCNQNSFSNAEIFSHAIKELDRGKLVGVTTAGGVVSTGSKAIMDLGTLRIPFRGWFRIGDGEDMELNGAVPDFEVWPHPGELPAGKDRQIEKAVEVLLEDVEAFQAKPKPKLIRASERE